MAVKRRAWGMWRAYSFVWVTLALFVISFAGHWTLAWFAYVDQQAAHGLPPQVPNFLIEVGRDTLENWQSEFLQLIWQVAGLAFLFHLRSPQSKDGSARQEEKIDALLSLVGKQKGEELVKALDLKYPR
jgi:lysylphosphatidylglycerol synthetase-like protein (DUF2156 family)